MRIRRPCPICQEPITRRWTWLGIFEAIFCFPLLWCCLKPKLDHCPHCHIDVIVADGSTPKLYRNYRYYNECVIAERNYFKQLPEDTDDVGTEDTSIPDSSVRTAEVVALPVSPGSSKQT